MVRRWSILNRLHRSLELNYEAAGTGDRSDIALIPNPSPNTIPDTERGRGLGAKPVGRRGPNPSPRVSCPLSHALIGLQP
jgi:hypothetical protein